MPVIRPSSDLRNNYNEISEFCNTYNEPVFITKNGSGDCVVMSISAYEDLLGKQGLVRLINLGLEDEKAGRLYNADEVFAELEKKFNLKEDLA